jgi:hypothetical protein
MLALSALSWSYALRQVFYRKNIDNRLVIELSADLHSYQTSSLIPSDDVYVVRQIICDISPNF